MTNKNRAPGSFLLSMIAKARSDSPRDLSELSDAELIRSMADGLSGFLREASPNSSDDDDFAAFACMFALGRAYAGYHPPSEGEDDALAVAENLLTEIGQEFDREELRSIWRSDAFAEFRKLFGKFEQVGIADQPNEEIAAWCAELCQCARNGVSVLEYDSTRSINGNSNNGNATHHGSK
jgi:hypothetical protein